MSFLKSSWFPLSLGLIICIIILSEIFYVHKHAVTIAHDTYHENEEWIPPEETYPEANADLIQYGRDLIVHTATYLGPQGIVSKISNGMNCQNCHLDAGRRSWSNPFSSVYSLYPKFRERSGRIESVEWRVNECMQRSLNGRKLDSDSREMKAMVAYINWVGGEVPKGVKPLGAGTETLPFLNRAADTSRGKQIYSSKCEQCHKSNGEGMKSPDGTYAYPPVWGDNSYNISAGMYLLSRLAGFIKNSMPFGSSKQDPGLTVEEAWDVAAYINSMPRPQKLFAYDWPDISKKPVDYPFGPYSDNFSEKEHKYGPFERIKKTGNKK